VLSRLLRHHVAALEILEIEDEVYEAEALFADPK